MMITWRTTIEANFMRAARSVREAMLLQICAHTANLDAPLFDAINRSLFQNVVFDIDHLLCLASQMHLARSAMARLGLSQSVFGRAVPKVFSFEGEPPEVRIGTLSRLWPAYQAAAEGGVPRRRRVKRRGGVVWLPESGDEHYCF